MKDKKSLATIFGKRIVDLRKKKNISQEHLAYNAGMSVSQLRNIEHAHVKVTLIHAKNLAKALNTKIEKLVKDL